MRREARSLGTNQERGRAIRAWTKVAMCGNDGLSKWVTKGEEPFSVYTARPRFPILGVSSEYCNTSCTAISSAGPLFKTDDHYPQI